ncbi:MAG: GntR family transcriptional regulator [Solirubrobacteraceae bacterium]
MSSQPSRRPKVPRSRSSEVYDELRRGLLFGEYPLIERLAEVSLAERLGASRTPVREALMRLESEGLVVRRPQGGFYPRSPNLAGVRDLYELRRILELASLVRPPAHGQRHDEIALRAIHDDWADLAANPPEPDPGLVVVDENFHLRLAEAAGNPAVVEQLQVVNDRIRVVRMQNFVLEHRVAVTTAQHLAILDALLGGDPDTAVALLGAHLDEAMAQASDRAAQAIERMMTAGALLGPPAPIRRVRP